MQVEYNTDMVEERDRLSYWREAVCSSYVNLECHLNDQKPVDGKILLERYSELSLSFVNGGSQRVERRKKDVAKATDAYYLLSIQRKNSGILEQGGRHATLQENDFVLYSSITPYTLSFDSPFDQLVIQIPRETLIERLPNADLLTGQPVNGSIDVGKLVSSHILEFAHSMNEQNPHMRRFIQDNMLDLVTTGLASLKDCKFQLSNPEQQLLLRAKAIINANIGNPDLNRAFIAKNMGMSVRNLSNVFAKEDTSIAGCIRHMRLDKVATELRDSRKVNLSISEIAIKWGLHNLQHFSKIFKDRFALPPREYRIAHLNRNDWEIG